ncbi:hypothetical protein ABK040_001304 [Willaertia magna]
MEINHIKAAQTTIETNNKSISKTFFLKNLPSEIHWHILNFLINPNDGKNYLLTVDLSFFKLKDFTIDSLVNNFERKHLLFTTTNLQYNIKDWNSCYGDIVNSDTLDFNWTCPEIEKKETVSNLTNNENDITVRKEEKIDKENEMKDEEEENSEEEEDEEKEEDDYNEDSDNENKEENDTKKRKLENEQLQEMDIFTKEIYDTNKLITTQIKQMQSLINNLTNDNKSNTSMKNNKFISLNKKIKEWNSFLDKTEKKFTKEISQFLNDKFFTKIKFIEAKITRIDYHYSYKAIVNICDKLILLHDAYDDEGCNPYWSIQYFTMDEYINMQNNRFLRGKFLFNMSSESLRIDKRELYNIKNEILSDFKDLEMQVPPKKKEEENKTNLVKDEVDDGSVDNLLIDCLLEALPWEIEWNCVFYDKKFFK